MDAHGFGGGFAAQERIVFPCHEAEKHSAAQHHGQHDEVGTVGGAAKVTEAPDHGGRQTHVGGIELQNGGGCRPDGADGHTRQHHHIGGKGADRAKTQNQQHRQGGKEKGKQGRGIGVCTHVKAA